MVDWNPPTDDQISLYGAVITKYHVLILQSDGVTYTEVLSDCPSSNAELISNTQCTVKVSTLTASPYFLTSGSIVYAKITAENSIGISEASLAGSGSTIFIPVVPSAPTNLVKNQAGITKTTASFSWTPGPSGGAFIIDYKVSYD